MMEKNEEWIDVKQQKNSEKGPENEPGKEKVMHKYVIRKHNFEGFKEYIQNNKRMGWKVLCTLKM